MRRIADAQVALAGRERQAAAPKSEQLTWADFLRLFLIRQVNAVGDSRFSNVGERARSSIRSKRRALILAPSWGILR